MKKLIWPLVILIVALGLFAYADPCYTTHRSRVLTSNSDGFHFAIYGFNAWQMIEPVSQVADGGRVLLGIGGHDYIVAKDAGGQYVTDGCFLP